MRVHVFVAVVVLGTFAVSGTAQQAADTREAHCAAARAAAGTEYVALYNRFAEICNPANQPRARPWRGSRSAGGARA